MNTTSELQRYRIKLALSSDELLKLYRGQARSVSAVASCGKRIQFPALALQRFVRHNGVHGHFEITVDADNKLQSVVQIDGSSS